MVYSLVPFNACSMHLFALLCINLHLKSCLNVVPQARPYIDIFKRARRGALLFFVPEKERKKGKGNVKATA